MNTLPFVIGLILVCGSAAGLVLIAARSLRIDRALDAMFGPAPVKTTDIIEHLAAVADVARHEGLLVAEQTETVRNDSILREGLALALAGESPRIVRDRLENSAGTVRHRLRFLSPRLIQTASIIVFLAMLLVVVFGFAQLGSLSMATALAAWLTLCAAMVAVAIAGSVPDSAAAGGAIREAMSIETAVIIASGRDGSAVRRALGETMPQASASPLARAA